MMKPKVMLRELRRQERHVLKYVRKLGGEEERMKKSLGEAPLELQTALSAAKANLTQVRKDIKEWRAKAADAPKPIEMSTLPHHEEE
jgi:hypothetical protein